MKIIIVGAGQVGGTLAEHLASERNDITLIDKDSNRLRELQDRLDIGTVAGHGSHPGRAGARRRRGRRDACTQHAPRCSARRHSRST